jgi:hypothetical protein
LYEIDSDGTPRHLGTLSAISGGGYHVELIEPSNILLHGEHVNGIFPGIPWFLRDMRPRGFMGRALAHAVSPTIGIPDNPERWTDDELMIVLLTYGSDLPGSYLIGSGNMDAHLNRRNAPAKPISANARVKTYPGLAEQVSTELPTGSSAGGEQPKFTATVEENAEIRQVIVKFSGARTSEVGQRWADLLVAEHWAARILSTNGYPAVDTAILDASNRTFLEVTRFDRVGMWGRRPVASLEAIDAGLAGNGASIWGESIPSLLEQGFISNEDARRLEIAYHFGLLIGNDDMHPGNLSFHLSTNTPLRPSPIYDMLPMHYAPRRDGALPSDPVIARPARPEEQEARRTALCLAREYWHSVATDPRTCDGFRKIALENYRILGNGRD